MGAQLILSQMAKIKLQKQLNQIKLRAGKKYKNEGKIIEKY